MLQRADEPIGITDKSEFSYSPWGKMRPVLKEVGQGRWK